MTAPAVAPRLPARAGAGSASAAGGARRRRLWGGAASHAALLALCAAITLPVVQGVLTSLRPAAALYDRNPFAAAPTLEHYAAAVQVLPLGRLLLTTTAMALLVAVGQCALATSAAYGLVHVRARGGHLVLAFLLAATLVPQQALIMPHYLAIARSGLLDTMTGLVLPQLASSTLAIHLLHQHMRDFPVELVEAARVDGATPRQILLRIVLPNLRAPLVAVLIIVFVQAWNEYLWPLLATTGIERATVQVGLSAFQTEQGAAWGPLLAAAVLVAAPLLVAYVVLQRAVTDAFVRSGLV